MCTVVCRWSADSDFPVQMLALRDELISRAFDLPAAWWPEQPDVIGGRDRKAGGSWCVSDVRTGVTGVVLNRPERREAAPGAPSRGVLPLLAVRHDARWPQFLDVTGMAAFNLVLAGPSGLHWWSFDGERLDDKRLSAGTYMFTPGGLLRSGLDPRFGPKGAGFSGALDVPTRQAWPDWLAVIEEQAPSEDPAQLLVRTPIDDDTFATVFGQFLAARPGTMRLDHQLDPAAHGPWTTRTLHPGPELSAAPART